MADPTAPLSDGVAEDAVRDTPRIATLVFNDDGTLSPEQIEGLPEDLKAQVTSPEFIKAAAIEIRRRRLAESHKPSAFRTLTPVNRTIRITPPGVSRRDFRAMSRIARRALKGTR